VEPAHQAMPANDTAGIRHHILEFPSNWMCIGNCEWYTTAFLKFNKYQFRNNQHHNIATTTTTTTTWILNRGRTATHATLCPFPAQRQYCHCQGCQSQHGRFGKRSCPST
jgi:hypothetical protein